MRQIAELELTDWFSIVLRKCFYRYLPKIRIHTIDFHKIDKRLDCRLPTCRKSSVRAKSVYFSKMKCSLKKSFGFPAVFTNMEGILVCFGHVARIPYKLRSWSRRNVGTLAMSTGVFGPWLECDDRILVKTQGLDVEYRITEFNRQNRHRSIPLS